MNRVRQVQNRFYKITKSFLLNLYAPKITHPVRKRNICRSGSKTAVNLESRCFSAQEVKLRFLHSCGKSNGYFIVLWNLLFYFRSIRSVKYIDIHKGTRCLIRWELHDSTLPNEPLTCWSISTTKILLIMHWNEKVCSL